MTDQKWAPSRQYWLDAAARPGMQELEDFWSLRVLAKFGDNEIPSSAPTIGVPESTTLLLEPLITREAGAAARPEMLARLAEIGFVQSGPWETTRHGFVCWVEPSDDWAAIALAEEQAA
jgi:hypothetical protein